MHAPKRTTWLPVLLSLAACGGSGGSTGGGGSGNGSGGGGNPGGGSESLTTYLHVLTHEPAQDAVQVAPSAALVVTLDGRVRPECLEDPETYLAAPARNERLPLNVTLLDGGRTLRIQPGRLLAKETDYVLRLSPLTCSTDGRLLENAFELRFRTVDDTPPVLRHTSIPDGATNVARTSTFTLTFSEPIHADSVRNAAVALTEEATGHSLAVRTEVKGAEVLVDPLPDLAGARRYHLTVDRVTDRAGNSLPARRTISFTTAPDTDPPDWVSRWPASRADMSPHVRPEITFDESIDPDSLEPGSVIFMDDYASVVPFDLETSPDLRTLRLIPRDPLRTGRTYVVVFVPGFAGVTDLSGNHLQNQGVIGFGVGADATPPVVTARLPGDGERRVSLNVAPTVKFSEPLDPDRVNDRTVFLELDGRPVPATVSVEQGGRAIRIVPVDDLRPARRYRVRLRGGSAGLRDPAGNVLGQDVVSTFVTAASTDLPDLTIAPPHGNSSTPANARVSIVFTTPIDPATVTPRTVQVVDDNNAAAPGRLQVLRDGRLVRFLPNRDWTPGSWYTVRVKGGAAGVRTASGNWLAEDAISRFRATSFPDHIAPDVSVSVNAIDASRKQGLTLPPYGFTVDLGANDPGNYALDPGSFTIRIRGAGPAPGADTIFREATVRRDGLTWRLAAKDALAPGDYVLRAEAEDLSGNRGVAAELAFRVAAPDAAALPFERTQVVWVRFDLDRDASGRADFEEDLLRLGLVAAGDPAGTNARMIAIVADGILARANEMFHRSPRGGSTGPDSVAVLLTRREPRGVEHTQIACGGLDPEGDARRTYGAESTGVLGRAFFDYRNGSRGDRAIGTRPGLGVFPGELFLFEAAIHIQVYPSFVTPFAKKFLALAPKMGGTPAGAHPLDRTVLAPGFDYARATPSQKARYNAVFGAADDWATAVGVLLAHEIGHTVGLVAEGRAPRGLFGDRSLHNSNSRAGEVMASAVSYSSLVSLDYGFRDLNTAYLRQRVMLK